MQKLLGLVMILPVLIAEFELRASFLLQGPFIGIEFREGLDAVLATVVAALIKGDFIAGLPSKECVVAVGAKVF